RRSVRPTIRSHFGTHQFCLVAALRHYTIPMPLEPSWYDITIPLALTVFAGGSIGINRGEHGQPAGMRTTILVCLAAAVSMIQANLFLPTAGKASDSFVTLDVMRLPLGILSGMGFIGAGAILRR